MIFELELFLLFVLLLLSAFFSGSEVALISIDKLTLRKLSKQRAKGVKLLKKLKKRPHRMLTTILIGNNLVNILVSSLATALSIEFFGSLGIGIAVGIVTFFILVFGEIFPKSYCEANKEKVALFSAPIIYILSKLFYPLIFLFEIIPMFLFKYIFKNKQRSSKVTEQDILTLAELGVEEKAIHPREKETIEKVLKFNDVSVKEIMIPKKDIICLNANTTVPKALEIVDKFGHSRYPVFEGKKSNLIGIVHIKEMLRAIKDNETDTTIKFLTINALRIPSSEKIDATFRRFQKTHVHMAFVVNKKNKMIGLVTFEDIIEEIFGEIEDEEDILRSLDLRKI